MSATCSGTVSGQVLPKTGPLKLNASLAELKSKLLEAHAEDTVFTYVIATIHKDEQGRFLQMASAPNFEGGLITLCTCKHRMRSAYTPEQWLDHKWVAGFSGISNTGEQDLVYLMKVGEAFESFQDLWEHSRLVTDAIKQTKSASRNIYGDLFEPTGKALPFDPVNYKAPLPDHVHAKDNYWHHDVDLRYGKPSTLLVGAPEASYLWDRPRLAWNQAGLTQGHRKMSLQELLERVEEEA